MIIRIADIPPEGRELQFELNVTAFNSRLELAKGEPSESHGLPFYLFLEPINVSLYLRLEGSSVFVTGTAQGSYKTVCCRCCEDTAKNITTDVNMILKPRSKRGPDEAREEDLNYGFYDGKEVNCSSFVEELLILAVPYTVLCSDSCKGLCPNCGKNLNLEQCQCSQTKGVDERFAVLRGLKLTH